MQRKRTIITIALVAVLFVIFFWGQFVLRSQRASAAPALSEGVLAALGGVRSLVAEAIWFRADRLQDEGRYVELAQLATALTAMEPHTPEVWSYAAWNLAYNISVMMPTDEDRWRWVQAALCLLRDEGLRLNPRAAELYRELAWMFELKLGTDLDSAAATYRRHWAETVRDAARRNAWDELGMSEKRMRAVEKASGADDWTDPQLSAIYWASAGLPHADKTESRFLLEIIRQARVLYEKAHRPAKQGASLPQGRGD